MRKEVTLAIFFGTLIGLTVAYGIWKATTTISRQPNSQSQKKENQTQQPETKNSKVSLEILSPEKGAVSLDDEINVQGVTQPGSFVIISTNQKDYISTVPDNGEFTESISLSGGINQIQVFSTKDAVTTKTQTWAVYTTEIETSSAQEKASLIALTGTITDISETTIQIRSDDGQINQLSANAKTSYANIINETKKINFTDLAIGDFIIAVGTKNTDKILEVKRVLVSSPQQELQIDLKTGIIESIAKSTITLTNQTQIDFSQKTLIYTVNKDNKIKKATTKSLTESSQIVSTGRTIFVLQ